MKKLSIDFRPSETTYSNLCKHGAIPEFVDDELEMFMAYFIEKGEEWDNTPKEKRTKELQGKAFKSSWQMTCQRWMRNQWRGKAGRDWENNRDYKRRFATRSAGGITFQDQVTPNLDLFCQETPPARERRYKIVKSQNQIEMERLAAEINIK